MTNPEDIVSGGQEVVTTDDDDLSECESIYQVEFSRTLGAALKRRRKSRQWTLEELVSRMESLACNKVSVNTIAAYERGARAMFPVRLVELCDALDIPAAHILDEVYQALSLKTDHQITVDLRALAHTSRRELSPARRWALQELSVTLATKRPVRRQLTRSAVDQLAILCALDTYDLMRALREPIPA